MEEFVIEGRYVLTGKEALNCHEVAAVLGELTETTIPCLKCKASEGTFTDKHTFPYICGGLVSELIHLQSQ